LDWGCGTGIAHRAFFHHFDTATTTRLALWDRSQLAVQFASQRMQAKYPAIAVRSGIEDSPTLLLVSHVLTELSPDQATALAEFAARASAVIWVEPGTYEASLALIAIRERLRNRLSVVAPCPHQARCGLLASGNERHWCHHFATVPGQVFTDAHWARFGQLMGIDLRSLPLSYLVLDRRPAPLAPGAFRVIGQPRVYKPYARVLACETSGVREQRLDKRHFPELYRQARKQRLDSLQRWSSVGGVIQPGPAE
jgi:ribosomal protein RSM22 (predicted rRNA methylase)